MDADGSPPFSTQSPVTRLSKSAGIVILLVGLGLTLAGASIAAYSILASDVSTAYIGLSFGIVQLAFGVPQLVSGIGVLRGAMWGRRLGVFVSVTVGLISFFLAQVAGKEGHVPLVLVFGSAFLFYAYSLIVLVARWRASAAAVGGA
jgi:hypothetical protein